MSWAWYSKKDTNYYVRLSLINKVAKIIKKTFDYNKPMEFNPPIIFTYKGGKQTIINIEWHKYMSDQFKREFTHIRVQLDNSTYVLLTDLRTSHLMDILKILSK